MSAVDKATPRPWSTNNRSEIGPRFETDDQSDGMLDDIACAYGQGRDVDTANAALIVLAVNERDELIAQRDGLNGDVTVLGQAVERLSAIQADLIAALEEIARDAPESEPVDPGATGNHGDSRDYGGDLTHWHLGNIARAAISKVKAVNHG